MSIRNKIAFTLYFANGLAMLAVGFVYQFSDEFMPYHADVIQTQWSALSEPQQVLYIGMMRTEAAGFLAAGTAILILLFYPFRKKEAWSTYAMTLIGMIEYAPSAIATFHVANVSDASPPWPALFLGILLLVIACWSAQMSELK